MGHDQTKITMFDVALKLGLPTDRNSLYVDCPNCNSDPRKHNAGKRKLNINYGKNVFRCNRCGDKAIHTEGGPLDLYMLFMGLDNIRDAYKDFEEPHSGRKKQKPLKKPQPPPPPKEDDPAPIAVRDATYRALLTLTNLLERHFRDLMARGLSEDQIKRNCYRSYPSDPKAVARQLQRMGCTLEGVPGFYKDTDGLWTMVTLGPGILIPQRNSKGQIQGFQIRLDQIKPDGPRYISLSSRDRDHGAPAHSYVHFRRGARGITEVVLTEGALKADVICALSGYSVISVPGVNSQKYLPLAFKSLLKRGMKKIRIAYDMDSETNEHVRAAKEKLVQTLNCTCPGCGLVLPPHKRHLATDGICPKCGNRMGIPHSTVKWDPEFKGLDDYLLHRKQGKETS